MPDFMPDSPPPQPTFLTYISDRAPNYKFHRNLGQARNAVGYGRWNWVRGGKIFEWRPVSSITIPDQAPLEFNYDWVLLCDIKRGTTQDELPWNVEKAAKRKERELKAEKAKLEARLKELDGL